MSFPPRTLPCCAVTRLCKKQFAAPARALAAANLLLVDLEGVAVLHIELQYVSDIPAHGQMAAMPCVPACTYRLRVVCGLHSLAVKEEAHAGDVLALAVAEGVHQLAELSRSLDLEEDLVVVIGDLDVEVLGLSVLGLLVVVRGAVVGHCGREERGVALVCGECRLLWPKSGREKVEAAGDEQARVREGSGVVSGCGGAVARGEEEKQKVDSWGGASTAFI